MFRSRFGQSSLWLLAFAFISTAFEKFGQASSDYNGSKQQYFAELLLRRTLSFQCNKDGFFRDPYNCSLFYRCADLMGDKQRFQLFKFNCPPGTVYDDRVHICNHPQGVLDCDHWVETEPVKEVQEDPEKPGIEYVRIGTTLTGKPVPGSRPIPLPSERESSGTDFADPVSPNVPSDVANQRCKRPGLFRSPENCQMFHICVDVFGNGTTFQLCEYPCPGGTVFSNRLALCTEPHNAEPCIDTTTTTPTGKPISTAKPQVATSPSIVTWTPVVTHPTTQRPTLPPVIPGGYRCTKAGYFRHPTNCSRYFQCVNLTVDHLVFQKYEFACGLGTVFDESLSVCNHPSAVPQCGSITTGKPLVTLWPPITFEPSTLRPIVTVLPPGGPWTPLPPGGLSRYPCKEEGFFRDHTNCSKFYRCVNVSTESRPNLFISHAMICGPGTVFNEEKSTCDHPSAVPACSHVILPLPSRPTTAPPTQPAIIVTVTAKPEVSPTLIPTSKPIPTKPTTYRPITPTGLFKPCTEEGFFKYPTNCSRFYRCVYICGNITEAPTQNCFRRYRYLCAPGTVFDDTIKMCNYPANVPGCEGYTLKPVDPSVSSTWPTTFKTGTPFITQTTSISTSTPAITWKPTLTPHPPTARPIQPQYPCYTEGYFKHPTNCSLFYRCVNTSNPNVWVSIEYVCGPGTAFDVSILACNHPHAVPGCEGIVSPPLPSTQPTVSTPITLVPSTGTPVKPPPTSPSEEITPSKPILSCQYEGYFRNPYNCSKFYFCRNVCANPTTVGQKVCFQIHEYHCGEGTAFDESINSCNNPLFVPGCQHLLTSLKPRPSVTPTSGFTSTTDKVTTAISTSRPVTLPPPVGPQHPCAMEGFFRHPTNCSMFYRCVNVSTLVRPNAWISIEYACGPGTVFDSSITNCNHPSAVPGCYGVTVSPQTQRPITLPHVPSTQSVTLTHRPVITTPTPIPGFQCTSHAFFPHPTDCRRFFICMNTTADNTVFVSVEFFCGEGSVFDPSKNICDFPHNVPKCKDFIFPTSRPTSPFPTTSSSFITSIPTTAPPLVTTRPPTIGPPCTSNGFFRNPNNCSLFYRCVNLTQDHLVFKRYDFTCGQGTVFDIRLNVCTHPQNVPECTGIPGTISPSPKPSVFPPTDRPIPSVPTPSGSGEGTVTITIDPYPGLITVIPTIPDIDVHIQCITDGFRRHPHDCGRFFRCIWNVTINAFSLYAFSCGSGAAFNEILSICTNPLLVKGCENYVGTTLPCLKPSEITTATISSSTTPKPSVAPTTTPTTTVTSKPTVTYTSYPSSTRPTSTASPQTTSSRQPGTSTTSHLSCTIEGFFRHPLNCSKFYRCVDVTGKGVIFKRVDFDCPVGTIFDYTINSCNYPHAAPPCLESGSQITSTRLTSSPTNPTRSTIPASSGTAPWTTTSPSSSHITSTETSTQSSSTSFVPVTEFAGISTSTQTTLFVCPTDGKFGHAFDCTKFYLCQDLFGDRHHFHVCEIQCPDGHSFDERSQFCVEGFIPCYIGQPVETQRELKLPFPWPNRHLS